MKIELNNTTFIIFYRKDNNKRERNLNLILDYYFENIYNPTVIVCQEVGNSSDTYISKYPAVKLITLDSSVDYWNKSIGYNTGIVNSNTDVLCFNDVDVVVDVNQLKYAEQYLTTTLAAGLLYPFDGRFLCVDEELTNKLANSDTKSLSILKRFEPPTFRINDNTEHVFVGHNNSPGGIVMGRRDTFHKMNGYCPMFKGWGYEDSEILSRSKILGYKGGRITTGPCWHFNHTDEDSSKKETQPFHESNRQLCAYIESMNKEQLKIYIEKSWKM